MDRIEKLLSVPTIDRKTNFWMIRTKQGAFFDEFLQDKYLAIGWNSISEEMLPVDLDAARSNRLKNRIRAVYGDSRPGTALNKCIRFCREMKQRDIAVMVDRNRAAFVYIGDYYEEPSSDDDVEREKEAHRLIETATEEARFIRCPYRKKRKIEVIRVLQGDEAISPYLQRAFAKNMHSLSSMNEYAELVLSACFDAFYYEDKLTVTFRVGREEEINAFDLTNLVLYAAKLLSADQPKTVRLKTTLHSPGDVILQLWDAVKENALPLLFCYVAVFGGRAGDYELHSLIGVIKEFALSRYEKKKREIELRKLAADADLAEQEALGKKLENLEKIKALDLVMADTCVEPLAEAAHNLALRPSEETVRRVRKILDRHLKYQSK